MSLGVSVQLCGAALEAMGSGALWWPERRMLVVSDLHLGKSERIARRTGALVPPYEVAETLGRLEDDLDQMGPEVVVCLGDSFDDLLAARGLAPEVTGRIGRMQAGRRWVWIEGNHDPGPVELGGTHLEELAAGPLVFRHIAEAGARGEVSGHYHPKAGLRGVARPCFLCDGVRLILPAYGAYTGGLRCSDPVLSGLMGPRAVAILTGARPVALPMPR
ncbi:ligase-associated DNA damage response endonuclease PdeM [Pseudooceanicola sp. C21-150M6]|uniref:ligase-associated DNA damage response endonuclease PdeM n=1 Tax=Pseudooceanicola sp. C21-150M6 TaxID=3434355 RepID=UPI003D7FCD63